MKKPLSWGTGIIIVIGVFFIAMALMIAIAMTHGTDLVAENYYEKELKYQDRINSTRAATELRDAVSLRQLGDTVALTLSSDAVGARTSGTIHFYRPSDKQQDFEVSVRLDSLHMQKIATRALTHGLWKVQVDWSTGDREYFAEQPIVVQ